MSLFGDFYLHLEYYLKNEIPNSCVVWKIIKILFFKSHLKNMTRHYIQFSVIYWICEKNEFAQFIF